MLSDPIRGMRKLPRRESERGSSKLKAIVVTVIIVFACYAAFKIVPSYVAEYQLDDKMQETARFAVVNHYTEEQIKEIIYKQITETDIPARKEDIKVTTGAVVTITVDYTVPVDLLFFHTDLHFTPNRSNKAIM